MSLEVWFTQDIRNTLLALRRAQSAQPYHDEVVEADILRERQAYREGFTAALQSVAVAFGVAWDANDPRAFTNRAHDHSTPAVDRSLNPSPSQRPAVRL